MNLPHNYRLLQETPAEMPADSGPPLGPWLNEARAGASPSGETMRDILTESIGYYIISQHLIGSGGVAYKEGLLTRVAANCFVLYDEELRTYTCCDYFSLKFFQRFPRNERPPIKISQIMRDFELRRAGHNSGCKR